MSMSDAQYIGSIESVNVAVVRTDVFDRAGAARGPKPSRTGIDKRPATGPVRVHRLGLAGDTICDTENHGGLDQAVYAYALEDLAFWREELDRLGQVPLVPVRPGAVGENLTTRGIDVTGAVIGEIWQIADVRLEVCVPRIPCRTFAAFWGVDKLIKRFTQAGRPGAYLRVLTEGDVQAGSDIVVTSRPDHGLTIGETFRALTGDRALAPKLLQAPQLPADARGLARTWLAAAR
jgi:MOSC domain-containing protein YiiM